MINLLAETSCDFIIALRVWFYFKNILFQFYM